VKIYLSLLLLLAWPAGAASFSELLKECGVRLGFITDPFRLHPGRFSPQFASKGAAERWLYSMLPGSLDVAERDLLMGWPRQGNSFTTNKILRGGELEQKRDAIIFSGFTVERILKIFAGLHARSRSDREITAFRAVGRTYFGKEPEVGEVLTDAGLMNVSLERETVRIHGENRARREAGSINFILSIPKNYPMVPTLAHHAYTDSTGKQNLVSLELEATLAPNAQMEVVRKYVDAAGVLTLELRVLPRS
jgi:hypothetical protein